MEAKKVTVDVTTQKERYECPKCGKQFARSSNFDLHYRKVHPNDDTITDNTIPPPVATDIETKVLDVDKMKNDEKTEQSEPEGNDDGKGEGETGGGDDTSQRAPEPDSDKTPKSGGGDKGKSVDDDKPRSRRKPSKKNGATKKRSRIVKPTVVTKKARRAKKPKKPQHMTMDEYIFG